MNTLEKKLSETVEIQQKLIDQCLVLGDYSSMHKAEDMLLKAQRQYENVFGISYQQKENRLVEFINQSFNDIEKERIIKSYSALKKEAKKKVDGLSPEKREGYNLLISLTTCPDYQHKIGMAKHVLSKVEDEKTALLNAQTIIIGIEEFGAKIADEFNLFDIYRRSKDIYDCLKTSRINCVKSRIKKLCESEPVYCATNRIGKYK
jgi:hypothetical protein